MLYLEHDLSHPKPRCDANVDHFDFNILQNSTWWISNGKLWWRKYDIKWFIDCFHEFSNNLSYESRRRIHEFITVETVESLHPVTVSRTEISAGNYDICMPTHVF